jgi:choline O-acetyltransferase
MEQYYRLFSSVRIPGISKDKLVESHTKLALEPEHVIVICRNQIYVLDVIVNFTRLSNDDLYHQLRRIKRQSEEDEEAFNSDHDSVTFLTTLPRNEWAQARHELLKGFFQPREAPSSRSHHNPVYFRFDKSRFVRHD